MKKFSLVFAALSIFSSVQAQTYIGIVNPNVTTTGGALLSTLGASGLLGTGLGTTLGANTVTTLNGVQISNPNNNINNNTVEGGGSAVINPSINSNINANVTSNANPNVNAVAGNTSKEEAAKKTDNVQDIGYNKKLAEELALKNRVKPTTGLEKMNHESLDYYTQMGHQMEQEKLSQRK